MLSHCIMQIKTGFQNRCALAGAAGFSRNASYHRREEAGTKASASPCPMPPAALFCFTDDENLCNNHPPDLCM